MLKKINLYCSLLESLSIGKIKILRVLVREKGFLFLQTQTHHKIQNSEKLRLYFTAQLHVLSQYTDLIASMSAICCIFSCSTCLSTESQYRQMLGMSASTQQIINFKYGYGNLW